MGVKGAFRSNEMTLPRSLSHNCQRLLEFIDRQWTYWGPFQATLLEPTGNGVRGSWSLCFLKVNRSLCLMDLVKIETFERVELEGELSNSGDASLGRLVQMACITESRTMMLC